VRERAIELKQFFVRRAAAEVLAEAIQPRRDVVSPVTKREI
jgi:hypothetical protein